MDFNRARMQMVELQLARRGIDDERVLQAFREVPREEFVAPEIAAYAYADQPLGIGEGQTISQPHVVALTVQELALRGDERVLDIGTGSGYAAAILSLLAKEVVSVERVKVLADQARERLLRLGYDNVQVVHADGTLGWVERAPYDAIAVAAGAPEVPEALVDQLAVGGRLVMPVGPESFQVLTRVTRISETHLRRQRITDVRFVPLIGAQGWPEDEVDAFDGDVSTRR